MPMKSTVVVSEVDQQCFLGGNISSQYCNVYDLRDYSELHAFYFLSNGNRPMNLYMNITSIIEKNSVINLIYT